MSEAPAGRSPMSATVVIAQHVRPGREREYLRWQTDINDTCRTFPGFEAAEVVPPVPGVQDDCVVVFRFDSFEHLDGWLRSEARRALLSRGEALFAGDARQQVVAGGRRAAGMVVSTRVKPGREGEYREWQNTIDREAAKFPGFLGNEIFAPVPGLQEEWVVVVRFESAEHLKAWLASDIRRRLVDEAARLWHEVHIESFGGGFPGWFTPGTVGPGARALPPNWKQAMIVLLVLYPTVMLLGYVLSPWLAGLPVAVALFASNIASVAVLTWLLMPLVNRAFAFWLTRGRASALRLEALGIATVLIGYAVALALFLALG